MKKLILFDIDGTLIKNTPMIKHLMKKTLNEVFGTIVPIDNYVMSGKTDMQIMKELLLLANLKPQEIDSKIDVACLAYVNHTKKNINKYKIEVCPGAIEFVKFLSKNKDYLIGLLTGNLKGIVKVKLSKAGIDSNYFSVGAYGSDDINRNNLPNIALKRAKEKYNITLNSNDIFIIGDTPRDIECAHMSGAISISIATGRYSYNELEKHKPNLLFENLLDFENIIKQINTL